MREPACVRRADRQSSLVSPLRSNADVGHGSSGLESTTTANSPTRSCSRTMASIAVSSAGFTERECSQGACEREAWTAGCPRACCAADAVAPRARRRSSGIVRRASRPHTARRRCIRTSKSGRPRSLVGDRDRSTHSPGAAPTCAPSSPASTADSMVASGSAGKSA